MFFQAKSIFKEIEGALWFKLQHNKNIFFTHTHTHTHTKEKKLILNITMNWTINQNEKKKINAILKCQIKYHIVLIHKSVPYKITLYQINRDAIFNTTVEIRFSCISNTVSWIVYESHNICISGCQVDLTHYCMRKGLRAHYTQNLRWL